MPRPLAIWNTARDAWETPETEGLFCEHLDVYSETFPTSGSMRNGVAYEQPTWEPATDDSESLSLLRTVMADEAGGGPLSPAMAKHRGQTLRLTGQIIDLVEPGRLARPEKLLMTPVASEGTKPSNTMGIERWLTTGQVFLTNQIVTLCGLDPSERKALLPTPKASDGEKGGPNQKGSRGDLMLPSAVTRIGENTNLPSKDGNEPLDGHLRGQLTLLDETAENA